MYHCNEDQVSSFSVRGSDVERLNLGKHKVSSHSKSSGDAVMYSSSIFPSDVQTITNTTPNMCEESNELLAHVSKTDSVNKNSISHYITYKPS
ncbi:hypothetical protein POVCU2_0061630 [Plasmodium ovale curtisi]|uniref:PIR Superfamily Protein n=1 Tax=Plasmodium ovale curtisi TaxID=864141 RepID=A0A1A8WBV2_PLAOA|nr:hypothetical protein POVCU2_0061630 [Plasmodium ovale curtisi]